MKLLSLNYYEQLDYYFKQILYGMQFVYVGERNSS